MNPIKQLLLKLSANTWPCSDVRTKGNSVQALAINRYDLFRKQITNIEPKNMVLIQ